MPVSPEERRSPRFIEGVCCEECHAESDEARRAGARERDRQVRLAEARGMAHIGTRQTRGASDRSVRLKGDD
jgi:UPF0176 protein